MNNEDWWYRLIDYNWTRHPTAYCWRKKGYLTNGLMKTHKCKQRHCEKLDLNIVLEDNDKSIDNSEKVAEIEK